MSGWMFLLVLAHPSRPGQRAIKRSCVCVSNGLILHVIGMSGPPEWSEYSLFTSKSPFNTKNIMFFYLNTANYCKTDLQWI